jgi:hypothetical protein
MGEFYRLSVPETIGLGAARDWSTAARLAIQLA